MPGRPGGPPARTLLTSLVIHALSLALVLVLPAGALARGARHREVDVVFYEPRPPIEVPAPAAPPLPRGGASAAAPGPKRAEPPGPPAVAEERKASGPEKPLDPGPPDVPPGPVATPVAEAPPPEEPPQQKAGKSGLLAFKDQFASLAQDKATPRLGADAHYSQADEVGEASSRSLLTTNAPGSSGGINMASLSRSLGSGGGAGGTGGGGGGGAGGRGGSGGGGGVQVGHPTSAIDSIAGAGRPLAKDGPGSSRTDEEIQIVFDRYKAHFYRLYNRELRKDPTLQGQIVVRLTIEPDGSVSMCALQSTDMNAPDLAAQVVDIVKTINFGAKEGVSALTIVYPIDFLPAST